VVYSQGAAAVINADEPTAIARRAIIKDLGTEMLVTERDPNTPDDDFSDFSSRVPGCYVHLGIGEMRPAGQHHNTTYDFNDACMPGGVGFWCALVKEGLR